MRDPIDIKQIFHLDVSFGIAITTKMTQMKLNCQIANKSTFDPETKQNK